MNPAKGIVSFRNRIRKVNFGCQSLSSNQTRRVRINGRKDNSGAAFSLHVLFSISDNNNYFKICDNNLNESHRKCINLNVDNSGNFNTAAARIIGVASKNENRSADS